MARRFTVVSRKHKAGRAYPQYGCSAHKDEGSAICPNRQTIAEVRLANAVLSELRACFESAAYASWLEEGYRAVAHMKARSAREDDEGAAYGRGSGHPTSGG